MTAIAITNASVIVLNIVILQAKPEVTSEEEITDCRSLFQYVHCKNDTDQPVLSNVQVSADEVISGWRCYRYASGAGDREAMVNVV